MISIIDDDRSVREAVKSLIRSLGYDAVTFASAEEYLGADGTHGSECIITDVQMPGMTGIALQDRLIADGYRRPIIFMSSSTTKTTESTSRCSFIIPPNNCHSGRRFPPFRTINFQEIPHLKNVASLKFIARAAIGRPPGAGGVRTAAHCAE